MKISENFLNHGLQSAIRRANVSAIGPKKPMSIAAVVPSTRRTIPRIFTTRTHCIHFADLREPTCVNMPGTTIDVFLTPDQARFFCAPKKGTGKHNRKSLFNRRHHDLPTHEPDTDPGHRRAAERGHEIHPETAAYASPDRRGSRVAFPRTARSQEIAARHEIYRGVSHQRHRIHSVHLPDAVTGIRQVRIIGLVNNLSTIKN